MEQGSQRDSNGVQRGLSSPSFVGLLATQFLGAMNDNMFRWFVVPIGIPILGGAEALSLGLVCFTVPYLLFATVAGYLADRFSKRHVIVACKVAEIVLMVLGVGAILLGNITLLFAVVAMMGCQSALFGPAKLGSIPEMLPSEKISSGNGLMGLVTIVASAVGTFAGYALYGLTKPDIGNRVGLIEVWPAAAALVGVAVIGWMTSLLIARLPIADPNRKLPSNPVTETYRNLRLLGRDRPLLRTALGISFFWFLASLANVNINAFGLEVLGVAETDIGTLMVVLVIGVGLGSVLAGIWSGGKVELGIVPLGTVGIAVSSLMLFVVGSSVDPSVPASGHQAYWWTCFWLIGLGVSAGLFNIPLEAFLQDRSEKQTRGVILAASNFITFAFILASAGFFYFLKKGLELSPGEIFLVAGLGTVPVIVYIFGLLPQATIRFLVWLASHLVYRVRVFGRPNLPSSGGALIVANHVSWIDGILLLISSSRPIRMLAYADYTHGLIAGWVSRVFGVIPVKATAGPKSILRSLRTARQAIENGELVCIFPEGQLTRTGQMQPFQRGMMRIIQGLDAPVIPTYLDELWGSIFSYRGGKFFWKWPARWPYPVSIHFGKPLHNPNDVHDVEQAVEDMGADAINMRKERQLIPPRQFIRNCRKSLFRAKIADSTGTELTGGKILAGSLAMKRALERQLDGPDERMVGILLPPSVGGAVTNAAVTLSGRVAVNLNYTLSNETVNYCVKQCQIRHVLTSRKFLKKRPFDLDAEVVFLEDVREQIGGFQRLRAALAAYLLPTFCLEASLGLKQAAPDDLLTVIFTSGSTGEPKGVMLSHHNVGSNIDAVAQVLNIKQTDVLLGVLPFFHSFGYTVTLWLPLCLNPKAVYHFNPFEARQVGKLCAKHGTTIMIATPTFLRSYLKRCEKEQLSKLDLVIVGAEKLPMQLAEAFQQKFGVLPTEGYGTTELSPAATLNIPDHRRGDDEVQLGTKLGTIGKPLPGMSAKIIDAETGDDLGTDREGLLMIKGPNVMLGYLNKPDATATVVQDGWYNTGDIGRIDEDGFITITGRQSRFSKISGEMVPHIKVEEELIRIVDDGSSDELGPMIVVTSVPDKKKGERLVVLHKPLAKSIDAVLAELSETGLPNLWIPSANSFVQVDELPLLGTGKLDLKGIKAKALEKVSTLSDE